MDSEQPAVDQVCTLQWLVPGIDAVWHRRPPVEVEPHCREDAPPPLAAAAAAAGGTP